jgi:hypothetical protein
VIINTLGSVEVAIRVAWDEAVKNECCRILNGCAFGTFETAAICHSRPMTTCLRRVCESLYGTLLVGTASQAEMFDAVRPASRCKYGSEYPTALPKLLF